MPQSRKTVYKGQLIEVFPGETAEDAFRRASGGAQGGEQVEVPTLGPEGSGDPLAGLLGAPTEEALKDPEVASAFGRFGKSAVKMAVPALQIGAGIAMPGYGMKTLLQRTAANGLLAAGGAGIEGEDPATAALLSGLTDLIPGVAAKYGRRAFNKLGLHLGGAKFPHPRVQKRVLDAYDELADRGVGKGIPLGQSEKVTTQLDEAGKALQEIEEGIETQVPLVEGMGFTEPIRNANSLSSKAGVTGVNEPLRQSEDKWLREAATIRQGVKNGVSPGNVMADNLPGGAKDVFALENYQRELMGQPKLSWSEYVDQLKLSAREAGNISRGAAGRGKSVIEARSNRNFIPPDALTGAEGDAAMAKHFKELVDRMAEADSPEKLEAINKARRLISNLKVAEGTNQVLRGGGGVLSDLGQTGMRGGLASGLAGNVAAVTGAPQGFRSWAGIGGIIGLAPSILSRIGGVVSNAGKMTPEMFRLYQLLDAGKQGIEDFRATSVDDEPVRRRKP